MVDAILKDETKIGFLALYPFGADITGLDIRCPSQRQLFDLRHLLAEQGVAVIRNQFVEDADFVRFLQQMGLLTFTVGETPVADQPLLNVVSNVGRDRPPRSVFHTDTSYVAKPPAYTTLRAIALPTQGGETLFSNQYQAYETLPASVKQKLRGAKLLHVVSGLSLAEGTETQTWQPLFRTHPISRRIALYLSTPERCQNVSTAAGELSVEESARVVRLLYKHSIRNRRLYRHRWQPGDILIWDNRCTMHCADHSNVVGDRVLHRGLISGETPISQTA